MGCCLNLTVTNELLSKLSLVLVKKLAQMDVLP